MAKFTRALSTVRQWCTIKRTKNQTIKSCNFRSCVSQNAKLPRAFLFHSRWQLSKVVTLHNILALSTKSCWKVVEVENPKEIAMTNLYYGITINISQFISIWIILHQFRTCHLLSNFNVFTRWFKKFISLLELTPNEKFLLVVGTI